MRFDLNNFLSSSLIPISATTTRSTSSLPIDKSPETIYLTKSEFEQWIKLHSAGKQVQTFIYNEKNLIDDFGGGKTAIKWALKVVNHLFTKEELAAGM